MKLRLENEEKNGILRDKRHKQLKQSIKFMINVAIEKKIISDLELDVMSLNS